MDKRKAAIMTAHSPDVDEPARKRRRSDQNLQESTIDVGLRLVRTITSTRERSRYIAKEFKELPRKDLYPDYYEKIQRPISLAEIESNLRAGRYDTVEQLVSDIKLMSNNALTYNEAESQVARDALRIQQIAEDFVNKQQPPPRPPKKQSTVPPSPSPVSPVDQDIHEYQLSMLQEILELTDENGDAIAFYFEKLPDRKQYADYYKLIKTPCSLTSVKRKMQQKAYTSWSLLEDDINLIVSNAETYNEEGSEIIKDSHKLRNAFFARIKEGRKRFPDGTPNNRSGAKIYLGRAKAEAKEDENTRTPIPKLRLGRRDGGTPQQAPIHGSPKTNGRTSSRLLQTPAPVSTNGTSRSASLVSDGNEQTNGRYPSRHADATPSLSRGRTLDVTVPRTSHDTSTHRSSNGAMSPPRSFQDVPVRLRSGTPTNQHNNHLGYPPTSHPPPAAIDLRFRPPGQTLNDALLTSVEMYSDPNKAWSTSFPASPHKLIQNFAVHLSVSNSTILISPKLGAKTKERPAAVNVLLSGQRLAQVQARKKGEVLFECRLNRGMNVVEVVASWVQVRGQVGRPAPGEDVVERIVVHFFVMG